MKRLIFQSILIIGLMLSQIAVNAQRPLNYESPIRQYNTALELMQKHEYGSAQEYFQYVYENTTDEQYDMKSTSYFYQGVCAAKLNHGNKPLILILLGYRNHKTEVGLGEFFQRSLVALFDFAGQLHLFLSRDQLHFSNIMQIFV